MITWSEIETRAYAFQKRWRGCGGDERQYGQTFEKDLMEIFGVDWHDGFHEHPITTSDSVINYIDYYLPGKILIEMKSRGKSLDVAFFQAMQYFHSLKPEDQPVLVLVSDFDTIKVYNTTKQHHYKSFRVSTLKLHVRIFGLLAGVDSDVRTEIELNTDASYKMAKLHGALKENGYSGHELEVYLVRLLFCLFADDTGIFEKSSFFNYLQRSNPDGSDLSGRVTLLFSILDTPDEKRMKNLPEELKRFRYINGNLFSEQLTPPYFSAKMRTTLLECCDFDWTQISPAIFGAMFQGVMNPQERRELGAHYTSAENILKVIRPLFLDNLYDEFEHSKNTTAELQAFHKKIASLTFLDPACGCGNFLIITYQRLRELEFEVLKLLQGKNQMTLFDDITKVSVGQFYGIEIEEFPCEIAKVSMLLMKHLMDQEISHYFGGNFIQFPIRNNANIVKGNALRMDWNEVVPAQKLNYILGNPPFIGYSNQTIEQKEDIRKTYLKPDGKTYESAGKIDYVAGWYFKASHYISGTQIRGAFVSTNSICQGEQVADVWKPLFDRFNICINFAYRTFKWSNEARGKAAVHCVIVGFSQIDDQTKSIYDSTGRLFPVKRINPYLIEGPNIFVNSRSNPLANVSLMVYGSKPADGGFLFLTEEEKQEIIAEYPEASLLIRPFLGSKEYIQSIPRYCLWLENISPDKYSKIPPVVKRIAGVRQFRLQSLKLKTHDDATTPMLFQEIRQPDTEYILVPRVTSENRSYIPMGFITPNVICGDQNLMIPNATLCEFGVITSSTHMAWMRTVAGRLEMRYRYSAQIVYNNFPWPAATPEQKEKIEKTTQAILNARNLYPEASLADLYNELTMPPDLRKAHLANDKAVWEAYGKAWPLDDEPACVAHLMILYQRMV
jgi:hypothetical protein